MPLLKIQLTAEGDIIGQFDTEKQEFVSPHLIIALNQLEDNELFKFYSLADSCSINIAQENGITGQDFKGRHNKINQLSKSLSITRVVEVVGVVSYQRFQSCQSRHCCQSCQSCQNCLCC